MIADGPGSWDSPDGEGRVNTVSVPSPLGAVNRAVRAEPHRGKRESSSLRLDGEIGRPDG